MFELFLAIIATVGAYLLVSAALISAPAHEANRGVRRANVWPKLDAWLVQAGMAGVSAKMLLFASGAVAAACGLGAWLVFGGFMAPAVVAGFAATIPFTLIRARRNRTRAEASDYWPHLIDEIRVRSAALGQSIPQALLGAGREGPMSMRPAFEDAHNQWLLSTDFAKTIAHLKARLADPTADAVCETLLVAHKLGGNDVQQRLAALSSDRRLDLDSRREARAKQAGVQFAKKFVLVVPLGMAVVGMSIGNGRDAYSSPAGQVAVSVALLILAGCWIWAGRLIRLPEQARVLHD